MLPGGEQQVSHRDVAGAPGAELQAAWKFAHCGRMCHGTGSTSVCGRLLFFDGMFPRRLANTEAARHRHQVDSRQIDRCALALLSPPLTRLYLQLIIISN